MVKPIETASTEGISVGRANGVNRKAVAGSSSIGTALSTGRNLVLLQLLSRLLTFVLNQSLVRLAPPEVFGTAAIQFDLIYSTILFLSREGIRNALLRSNNTSTSNASLARLPLQIGLGVASAVVGIYLYTSDSATMGQPAFHLSFGLYVVAALLELGVEPMYIATLRADPPKLKVRMQAEGGMAIIKAVVTFGSLVVNPKQALLGFALGQVVGDAWLVGRYVSEWGLQPAVTAGASDPDTRKLAVMGLGQSVVKHVLTEGDRIVVGRISPLGDQGGYAIAINYGSLIARIIFQPVEETLQLHFSRQLRTHPSSTRHLLTYVLHLSSHLLLLLPAFLPPILPVILPLLLPARYRHTTAPSTLETYLTYYIPLMSLNGILEAFHASSATPAEIGKQARWMMASSVGFAGALWTLSSSRPGGITTEQCLVLASCVSMAVRIVYAGGHARRYFASRSDQGTSIKVAEVLPHPATLAITAVAAAVLRRAEGVQIILATGAFGVLTLAVLAYTERPRMLELRRILEDRK